VATLVEAGAAREKGDARRRPRGGGWPPPPPRAPTGCCHELPPACRPSPTDRPPLPRLPPAVRARRESATPASPTRGLGKGAGSCSEPAGATFLWLRLARSAPVTGILGTWSRSRPWSTPFGRAPGEAGFGAGDGALPKGAELDDSVAEPSLSAGARREMEARGCSFFFLRKHGLRMGPHISIWAAVHD